MHAHLYFGEQSHYTCCGYVHGLMTIKCLFIDAVKGDYSSGMQPLLVGLVSVFLPERLSYYK